MRIYLDTSALSRIFDDQSQPRIYLEATAILIVFMLIEFRNIEMVSSDILSFENDKNPYNDRKTFVNSILKNANETQTIDDKILMRSQEIEGLNIKGLDALHLACAERLRVDYFITCDDRIMKNYKGSIKVKNPVDFVAGILQKEENK
ncbi:PIN domain-containing protein [bacterium]|nr:PIN domain-containing protein [bacterium]